jgi:glucose-1-phosphate thymidylyltransferase
MWGVVPAAGLGTRIKLPFSKELLPLGTRTEAGIERPCAVSEYLIERLILAGVNKICFVISSRKTDIIQYFGAEYGTATIAYVVQPQPVGICDAVFRIHPLICPGEHIVVGLPDTVWFPKTALSVLPNDTLSFLLFPVDQPQYFDAVITDRRDRVIEVQVKSERPTSRWVWGAFKMTSTVFSELRELWLKRGCKDEYVGSLVNAYLSEGGTALGIKAGSVYSDVGTLDGYEEAFRLVTNQTQKQTQPRFDPLVIRRRQSLLQEKVSPFARTD